MNSEFLAFLQIITVGIVIISFLQIPIVFKVILRVFAIILVAAIVQEYAAMKIQKQSHLDYCSDSANLNDPQCAPVPQKN